MPLAPSTRPTNKVDSKAVTSAQTKKKKKSHTSGTAKNSDAAAAGTATAAAPNPKGVPVPAAVLMQALGLSLTPSTGSNNGESTGKEEATNNLASQAAVTGPSPSIAGMEVEVETKQGYIYTGKLALLDAHYNVQLHESLVRRARAFDFERAARELQEQNEARLIANSLQGSSFYDASVDVSTAQAQATQLVDRLPRPRYLGTVSLRSHNVVLMRFVAPSGLASSAAADESPWARLQKSFAGMASAIKAHLQREKMRRRAARRRRLDAKKT